MDVSSEEINCSHLLSAFCGDCLLCQAIPHVRADTRDQLRAVQQQRGGSTLQPWPHEIILCLCAAL